MSYKYLDLTGLSHFWDKIKAKIPTKTSQLTNDSNFNYSVEKASGTIDDLAAFTSGKQGLTGSISLAKKSSGVGSEIPAGWYNYYFAPHRSGVGGDNGQYGTIILTPMNFAGASWILRRSNSTTAITEVKKITTADQLSNYVVNSNFYINTHPENQPVLIPFIHNDIAFLTQRGGSCKIYYDGVEKTVSSMTNMFDGSPSYMSGIKPTTVGITEIVIELTLHKVFTWTNTIYCDFGSSGWRAKAVKIEVVNTNYTQDVWTTKLNTTTNSNGNIKVTFNHTPVGASNSGGGFNKIRFTFSSFNADDFRIAQLGVYNYGSNGVRETSMSRGIDDYVFRNITPNNNNTFNLGDSSHKWANVYATTFQGNATSATKATQDSDGNAINTTYYKASNPNGYTSNTGTITGIKMNGASKGTSGVVDLGTVITAHQDISGKVDKVSGKGLSTNDYTTTEKTKLSGIATGAEVNQNAFSNVKVGNTTIQADSKTDTLELVAGNNITLTPNSTNDSVTISATSGGGDNEAQLYNFVCSSVIPGDDNTNDTFVIDVDTDIRPNTFVYDSTATYTNVKLGFDFDLLGQCYGTNGINVRLVKNNTTLKEFNVYKKNGNDIDVNYINRYGTLEHVNTIMFNVAFDCSNSEVTVYGQGLLYYDDIIEPLTLYFDLIYPVGSIYMSVNNTNPATLFGRGTWVQLKDRFLLGAGDTYTAGNTGGEATHQLTKAELPAYDLYNASHSHNISTLAGYNGKQGNAPGVNGGNNQGSNTYTVSATIKVSSGGSNTPHNNMPPYLVVYMWKRTA